MRARRRRWVAFAIVTSAALASYWACLSNDLVPCGDLVCPASYACTPRGCAPQEAAAACATIADGASCSSPSIGSGTCDLGVCIPSACGNGIADVGEICDDSNTIAGDGCSADCLSLETCGNEIVDNIRDEQCDVGTRGLSGDGCSSRCTVEADAWRRVTASAAVGRVNSVLVVDANGDMLLIGGRAGSGHSAPLATHHVWDGTSWGPLVSSTQLPAISEHAIAYDSTRERVVLFGGTYGTASIDTPAQPSARTWEWDGVNWYERTPPVSPPARAFARMAYDSIRQRTVLYGGIGAGSGTIPDGPVLDDLWEWDGATGTWTERTTTPRPSPRRDFGMAFDPEVGQSLVIGGMTPSFQGTHETWGWNGTAWTLVANDAGDPSFQTVAAYDPLLGRTFALSGYIMYDLFDGNWTQQAGYPPGTSYFPALAFNPRLQRLVMASIFGIAARFGTEEWIEFPPLQTPRILSAALDRARGRVVGIGPDGQFEWDGTRWERILYGGQPIASMFYDTGRERACRYDGSNAQCLEPSGWTTVSTGGGPTLNRETIAFDSARGEAIFGGGSNATTWRWDGAWHQASVSGPPGRIGAAIAYDPVRERIVVFSGQTVNNGEILLDDTWEWNGTVWTQIATPTAPPSRHGAGFAYDARHRRLVLFGGQTSTFTDIPPLEDTWAWDGTSWTQLEPLNAPIGNVATSFSDARGELNVVLESGEVWRLRGENLRDPSDRCLDAGVDTDGDGLLGCADPDCWNRCAPACAPGLACAPDAVRCGDGTCSSIEDYLICPADCPAP